MPEQNPPPDLRNSSDPLCLKLGALALDTDDAGSEIYRKLGLKDLRKRALGTTPRFLSLISAILENSVQKNELLLETTKINDAISVFHGSRAPPVTIHQYMDRIFKYAGCSPSCYIVAYIYVDRYLKQTDSYLTSLNVHRLLVTCVMVATKFFDDSFFNNAYYAKVAGVSTSEMNRLEMALLFCLDFRLQVNVETFRRYCFQLEKEADASQISRQRKLNACWIEESWSRTGNSPHKNTPVAR